MKFWLKRFGLSLLLALIGFSTFATVQEDFDIRKLVKYDFIDEDFESEASLDNWMVVNMAGSNSWSVCEEDGNRYAAMMADDSSHPSDQWLISPALDLSEMKFRLMSFDSRVTGVADDDNLQVYVLFSANPHKYDFERITPFMPASDDVSETGWKSAGLYDLRNYDGVVYLGFRYVVEQSDDTLMWSIDNVRVNFDPEEFIGESWPDWLITGRLPVLHIDTAGGEPILSKKDYIDAVLWIDPMKSGFDPVGSEASPLKTEIRGRGNFTWTNFDKKPYKIKLDKKTSIFGMPKSKHWALLADASSLTVFTTAVAFEVSKKMGLPWTPSCQPIEVVLNGEYVGLYTLCETIRVEETRVNIHEQADNETDPAEIEGAWLLEIDNTKSDTQVTFYDGNGFEMAITPDTPEELSEAQMDYLTTEMLRLNEVINAADKSDSEELERLVDLDAFARYYLTQELIDNHEGFSGSCYFYKDNQPDSKWTFGPVWDMGNSLNRVKGTRRIYESNFTNHWVDQLVLFPAVHEAIVKVWNEFKQNVDIADIYDFTMQAVAGIEKIYLGSEKKRWPEYNLADTWSYYVTQVPKRLLSNYELIDRWYRELPEFFVYALCDVVDEETGEILPETERMELAKFEGTPDGLYIATVDELPDRFVISSADGESFTLSPLSVDQGVTDNEPVQVEESAGEFVSDYIFSGAVLVYNPAENTLTIEAEHRTSDIEDLTVDSETNADVVLDGRQLTAIARVTVYDISGKKISELLPGTRTELERGIYLVSTPKEVRKIIVK